MSDDVPPAVDTSVPQSARIWNYWLGGTDNFAVDRAAGDQVRAVFPGMIDAARYSRAFLRRAVGFLAGEAGVRQFLDVGAGCRRPTTPTRSPSGSTRGAASSTSTTTRWCWPTPGRC